MDKYQNNIVVHSQKESLLKNFLSNLEDLTTVRWKSGTKPTGKQDLIYIDSVFVLVPDGSLLYIQKSNFEIRPESLEINEDNEMRILQDTLSFIHNYNADYLKKDAFNFILKDQSKKFRIDKIQLPEI